MVVKLRLVFSITILFLSFYGAAQSKYWKSSTAQKKESVKKMKSLEIDNGQHYTLSEDDFLESLKNSSYGNKNINLVYFPDTDGQMVGYEVKETPVMAAELSRKYPFIKSYSGYSVSPKRDKIRFSVSHNGIQAMIVHGDGTGNSFMQKVGKRDYVVYSRNSFQKKEVDFICSTRAKVDKNVNLSGAKPIDSQALRKFRLAVSATGEYTDYHGGTVADALAAINATVTRINEVFESDLAVTLELVANTDTVIFTNAATDPYGGNLSSQTQITLTDVIGAANYDIGHLFNRDAANGNAGFVGAVCIDNRKGSAFASHPDPMGDNYDLDYVAHEMGHQFGANHTWSFEAEGTSVQTEPGSGTTIMGYAGIAGESNVAPNGDDYFHYNSIVQIADYLDGVGCAEEIALTNNPPTIVPTGNFSIPKSTAFALTGNASDLDTADVLSYTWEQIDDGIITQANFGPNNPTGANFRSQRPSIDSVRYFPRLSRIVSGNLTQINPPINSAWETVSDIEREMNFALTVRDNAIGGGQVEADLVQVSVVNNAGPFLVTSQVAGETYEAGSVMQVTWDVASTNLAPVNAQSVDVFLSTDGGVTFPTTIASNVPNNGSHNFIVPGTPTSSARIMIKASDNIFLAVNQSDFVITESEIVLNFSELQYDVCQPNTVDTSFDYETYLGFDEETTFSVLSGPENLVVSITPPTLMTDSTVTLVLSNTENVPEGVYQVVIMATSASVSKMVPLDLNIYDGAFADVVLTAPVDGATDSSVTSELQWEADPSHISYELEIATDLAFSNVVENIIQPQNVYVPLNLNHETTYFWRVKPLNACGEGNFGAPFSFTTIEFNCDTKFARDLPLEISTVGTPTITSKVSFFEDLIVSDINVNLEIDHTFLSDLSVSLTSPSGTKIFLISNSCGEENNLNATFDDEGSDLVCNGDPAISGTIKPLVNLSSFNGESIFGEWILEVNDGAESDGGILKAFSLDICIEGEFRPDDDNDDVFDDGDDLCLGTPEGATVDSNGCQVLLFAPNNFELTAQTETCRTNNDGVITINSVAALNYQVTVFGGGVNSTENFTDSYTISDLAAGTYSICINATEGTLSYLEQCFEVVISEPEPLAVTSKTAFDGSSVLLTLEGADLYMVEFNGELVQIGQAEIRLDLKKGVNALKVFTELPCQGVHEEVFFNSQEPLIFPNPTVDFTTVFLGNNTEIVNIKIFTSDGRFVQHKKYTVNGNEIELDLINLTSGIYYLQIKGDAVDKTVKVIKR